MTMAWTDRNRETLHRFLKFIVVGVVNTGFGFSVYTAFVLLGLAPQPALAGAFVIGVMWNFFTHGRFVFASTGLRRLPFYVVAYLITYGFNAMALRLLLDLGTGSILAQAILAPIAAIVSFFLVGKALTGRFPLFEA